MQELFAKLFWKNEEISHAVACLCEDIPGYQTAKAEYEQVLSQVQEIIGFELCNQLLERLTVRQLVLPDVTPEEPLRLEIEAAAAAWGADILWVDRDLELPLGDARLRIYAPLGAGSANEEGLSVLCSSGEFDTLLTGDMDVSIERRLVKYGDLPDIELLVAGHHGSKYASSQELLLAVRPEYAVISVGYNRYGHPAPEALERLAAAGCALYRTDWMGSVTFMTAAQPAPTTH